MKYTTEFDVRRFDFWAGAVDRFEEYRNQGRLDELQDLIENAFYGCEPSDTEINDFVWFDEEVNKIFDEDENDDENEDEE